VVAQEPSKLLGRVRFPSPALVHTAVSVIGGGVVGASVALAAARRGADVVLLEAEPELGLCASGTNSGILHTGFDSPPGTLETRMILRSAQLRDPVLDVLGIPVARTGAAVRPRDDGERNAVARLVDNARENGVEVELEPDGSLFVPGECVTDPVALTTGLAAAAQRAGAHIACGTRVTGIHDDGDALMLSGPGGEPLVRATVAVNCAGLFADEVARAAGDAGFTIYPRKGEFFVFEPPDPALLDVIRLPVPSAGTKGVLVFPTVDGKLVAGPTAHDQEDKHDWSVRPAAREEILGRAGELVPALRRTRPIAAYAGLRPAGKGVNYVIERSRVQPRLVHVAAIRSTGMSACLGIAEYVMEVVSEAGVQLGEKQPLRPGPRPRASHPWWMRSAAYWSGRG
jgi:glycerol-3-phosphate dehydrogenase